ncbi:MAG: sugar transferase [Thermoleophilia bacterium]
MLDTSSARMPGGREPSAPTAWNRFGELTTPELRSHAQARRVTALWLLLADLLVVLLATVAVDAVCAWAGLALAAEWETAMVVALAVPPVFATPGLYRSSHFTLSPLDEVRTVGTGVLVVAVLALALGVFVADDYATRDDARALLLWVPMAILGALVVRSGARRLAPLAMPDRVLIVGAGEIGQRMAEKVNAAGGQVRVVGFVDDEPLPLSDDIAHLAVYPKTIRDDGIERLGLVDAIVESGATRLVLAFSRRSDEDVLEYIRDAGGVPIPISIVPRYFEITPPHATVSELQGFPLITLTSARLSIGARLAKRTMDVVLAGGGLLLLAPVLAAIAIAVKLDSRGPVFFRQERVGSRGRVFRIWKFRTMNPDAEARRFELAHMNDMEGGGPLFKIKDDPRVTRVGRFLRKTSLDELPQLFNVVGGSMSLVGPRPFVTHEAIQIGGWGARRLDLTPGITGLWQVMGRNDVPFEEMVRLDYMYVTNWSVWWDLRLLLQTIPRVLTGRGAS